jgi:proton-dependent oligopeptide transporter, POT family
MTAVALIATITILNKATVAKAIATAKAETAAIKAAEKGESASADTPSEEPAVAKPVGFRANFKDWVVNHPFTDLKFTFFIFALIPVQTLFAYNWLVLPPYIHRAYEGWIGEYFEIAANFNPILIFFFAPIVAALTQKRKVYNMMLIGTFVMAAPAFFLAIGTSGYLLFAYLLIMTIGEAMWQPRFLQYAAEIAPEGRTGAYMGVAQFPWFLTKVVTSVYAGWFLYHYCPEIPGVLARATGVALSMAGTGLPDYGYCPMEVVIDAPSNETMWFYYGLIAVSSTFLLLLAKPWLGKDFKEKSD